MKNFYEEQKERLDRVSRKESSGLFLKSNKLAYELAKDSLDEQREALEQGRPTVQASEEWTRLIRSMGFVPARLTHAIDIASENYGSQYKHVIERLGFPEKICERTTCQLAILEIGAIRKPHLVISEGRGCDADHRYTAESLGAWYNIPVWYQDIPLNESDKPELVELNYIVEQLGEFIEWAEKKFPGVKYDKDRHIELLEADAIGQKYVRETYQLIKHFPTPIPPRDMLRHKLISEAARYPNPKKALEYMRICRDELGERVASGQGLYPERLRLLWAGRTDDFPAVDPSRVFMERKVAVPLVIHGGQSRKVGLKCSLIGEVSEYGVRLSPLQEEARTLTTSAWGGPGKRWVNDTMKAARDIGAEGILHFNVIGCTPMVSMGSTVAEKAEKEMGIPTLNIEARQMDRDFMSQEKFDEILTAFIDKCFDWAGKPRQ